MLQRRGIHRERGSTPVPTASVMEMVRRRQSPETSHAPDKHRNPEATVRHPIVGEDVGTDIGEAPEPDADQHRTAQNDERRRGEERPEPEQVIADDPSSCGVLVMRLVRAPERTVEDEPMNECHDGLGQQQRSKRDDQ